MTAFYPITPMKAVEFVEAAGVPFGKRVIADHAAAGLIKSYALAIETVGVDGRENCVRGAAVPPDLWQRIMREGMVEDVWTGGTVRLMAAEFIGGAPEVRITGIGFSEKYLQRLVNHHRGTPAKAKRLRPATSPSQEDGHAEATVATRGRKAEVPPIAPGAVVAPVNQAMATLNMGRTKITELMNDGTLERMAPGRPVRIKTASIWSYAGKND